MTDDQLIESLRARTWPGDCEAAAFRLEELRARVAELEALPGNVLARQLEKLEAERDALAAELKALREHEPFCWTTYPPSGRYSKCKAEVDLWERNSWTIVPLYARPVPDEPVNARLLDALKKCRDQFENYVSHHINKGEFEKAVSNGSFVMLANAAISEAEKQSAEAGHEND